MSRTLVCVAPSVPHRGVDHAGGAYLFNYLREITRNEWAVDLLVPSRVADPDAVRLATGELPGVTIRTYRDRRHLRGLIDFPVPAWRSDPELSSALSGADILDLHWFDAYRHAPWFRRHLPDVPIVATVYDAVIEVLNHARRSGGRWRRLTSGCAYPVIKREEVTALNSCDAIFTFKSNDLRLLRRHGVTADGHRAPPWIEFPENAPAPDPAAQRVVFPAAMWRDVNHEAALWFLDAVWPAVLDAFPDAVVVVAGSRPASALRARGSRNVLVTGYVEDLLEAYRGAAGVIAPLLRGAGLKFKVVQAMALGFPVIGTSVAFDGISDLVAESPSGIDDAAQFTREIISLFNDPTEHLASAATLRTQLRRRLDFRAAISQTISLYESLIDGRPVRRPAPRSAGS